MKRSTFFQEQIAYALRQVELRRLRQVEDESRRLMQLVADLRLDKHMLIEALRTKG